MPKRPKSDGRCIHCREKMAKETKDHVFPSAWYPDSTPSHVQHLTAPSCEKCNGESGEKEHKLLVRLALCVNPLKPEVQGLAKRALASLGIGVTGLEPEEMRKRQALKEEVFKDAKPYTGENKEHMVPGLGPHPQGTPGLQQLEIGIPGDLLDDVTKKIVRGLEWWWANGRIVEPPFEIEVLMLHAADLPQAVAQLMANFSREHLGPGFGYRRGPAQDGSGAVLYEIVVWDAITFYCSIMPPETEDEIASSKLTAG
jgi:hypothetical protein